MAYTEDFSGRPLVAGTIRGIRTWDMSAEYRLVSPFQYFEWQATDNVSECVQYVQKSVYLEDDNSTFYTVHDRLTNFEHKPAPKHCSCGFYAYHKHAVPQRTTTEVIFEGHIRGILEGYGTVTVGSKGFRAEKANILALIQSSNSYLDWNKVWDNYPEIPLFSSLEEAIEAFPMPDIMETA